MDINQAARMIEWLDEERRRDKTMIATLQERLAQQQDALDTLIRRLNSLESDQTVIRSQFVPTGRDNDILDLLRKEMQQVIEGVESKRLTAEREAERRSELAREAISRPVRDLTERIGKIERQTSEIQSIDAESDRLSGVVANLQQRVDDILKRFEEPDRRLAFLEEQRRQDARRISEVEGEVPEVRKQIDSIKPKINLLEDLSLRNERKIQDVQTGDRDRREQIQQFIDQQTLLLQQRDQQIQDLLKRFGEHDEAMKANMERFESWSEAYRNMKKIIDDFERIGDRLERRINEVAEMQRQFTLSNDEVWRLHDKEFERFVQRMSELEALFPPLNDSLNRLWNLERERAQLYRERYQMLLLEYDTGASASALPTPVKAITATNAGTSTSSSAASSTPSDSSGNGLANDKS